jgi:Tol biopolymer transport system component
VLLSASSSTASDIFLYDSASSAPQKLVSIPVGSDPGPRFVSAQKVAYIDASGGAWRIMSFDLSSRATKAEVTAGGYIPAFAFSHDGSAVAYLQHDQSGKPTLHVKANGKDTSIGLNSIPGRGVGRDDELRLEYSPDDKYLLMVDTFVGNQGQAPETGQFLVLRAADNTVAFFPPSGVSANATMAAWARHSNRLYYRDAVGVRTWDAEVRTVGTLASGLHWYDPAPSSDDRSIAFTDLDAQFVPHVRVYDLGSKQSVTVTTAPRSHPIYITADTLWHLEEQACQSECMGGPWQPSGKVLAYNLKSKTESALPFTDVRTLSQLAVASR